MRTQLVKTARLEDRSVRSPPPALSLAWLQWLRARPSLDETPPFKPQALTDSSSMSTAAFTCELSHELDHSCLSPGVATYRTDRPAPCCSSRPSRRSRCRSCTAVGLATLASRRYSAFVNGKPSNA